jgi:hypothetical protein
MPTLKLHLPEELLTDENKEDLLAFINKNIEEKDKQFKDLTSWIRALLRDYATGAMQTYRQWKSTGTVGTPDRKTVSLSSIKLWQGDGVDVLEDGLEGKEYPLTIGGLQYDYLKNAVAWENTYQREVLKSELEHKNVARLAQYLVVSSLLQLQRVIDTEKMSIEEEKLTENTENKD